MFEPRYTSKGRLVRKPVYKFRRGGGHDVLGECRACGCLNYVEPHGTTAPCRGAKCKGKWTEHVNLDFAPPKRAAPKRRHRRS